MKISIKKREDSDKEFDLAIFSDNFTGVLEHISEESLKEIERGINEVLSNRKENHLVWNPRSMRHEERKNDPIIMPL